MQSDIENTCRETDAADRNTPYPIVRPAPGKAKDL
jgi:hypothetical protein